MMEEIVFKAVRRTVIGKQVKALRREGQLPAVLYGSGVEPTPILLDLREATRLLGMASSSTLVTIALDGQNHKALVREKQRDFLRGSFKHIDFQAVSMKEKLHVRVPVVIVGESFAVKNLNGVLVVNVNELEVQCLPQDMPEKIVVDIAALSQIGSNISVRDLKISDKIEVLDDPEEVIAVITGQAAEEVTGEEGAFEPEVIEKGKKEEEE